MAKTIMTTVAVILVLGVTLIAGLSLTSRPAQDHPYYANPGFRIIAHRGGRGLGPENTLETFKKSLAAGADVLEMDLRMTRDGELVILHDATVDRTTNGAGAVMDMDLRQLKELDAGFRWIRDGSFIFRNQHITIPTLAEVFETFPETPFIIEIKDNRSGVCKLLCGQIETYRKIDSVLVASMHTSMLSEFRKVCPKVATSAGPRAAMLFYLLNQVGLTSVFSPPMAALQVPAVFRGRPVATPGFVSAAQRLNLKVEVWTVNDVEQMCRLIDAGVDGIMTDFPDLLMTVRDRGRGGPSACGAAATH
jgi:glycerophosphoryl diester phosphodiesterase